MNLCKRFVFITLVLNCFYSATCFEVVLDLPSQLTYNRALDVVLTIFQAPVGERIDVVITTEPDNNVGDGNSFLTESSYIVTHAIETHRLSVRANASSEVWTSTPDSDVMFNARVNVTVTSSSGSIWQREHTIPVVKIKGHIFIQTDRPVYQPKDKVLVRFIPVDDDMKPLNQPMDMSIMAPNPRPDGLHLISWTKKKAASKKVFIRSFELPDTPPVGRWIVSARFFRDDVISKEFYSTFYVGEITLPTFELQIHPMTNYFILPDDEQFSFNILARFIYGSPLDAMATVRVGLYNREWRSPLLNSFVLSPLHVSNGKLSVTVPVANLTVGLDPVTLFQGDTHFFVEVSVTERGGGQTRSIRNTDVLLTSSPVAITLDETSGYFKPGLPFVVKAQALFANGSAVSNLTLAILANGLLRNGRAIQLSDHVISTSEKGKVTHSFDVTVNVEQISITVRGQYSSSNQIGYIAEDTKEVYQQTSTHHEYIQIVLLLNSYPVGMYGAAEIYLTPASVSKTIVYSVRGGRGYFHSGEIVATANQHRALITFPIVSEMSPISHLTAYYVATTPSGILTKSGLNPRKYTKSRSVTSLGLSFVITDSASIAVEYTCCGSELSVSLINPLEEIHPGQSLLLEASGHPRSTVGVTGVDSAAASLRKDFESDGATKAATLSRQNLFDVMRSNVPGCEYPLKPHQETSFPSIGRVLLSSADHNTEEARSIRCTHQEQITKRKKRSASISILKRNSMIELLKSGEQFLGFDFECCAVGASNVTSAMVDGQSCSKRAATVTLVPQCRTRFLECCYLAAGMRSDFKQAAQPTLRQSFNVISVFEREMPILTSHSVMDQAMQMVRSRFAWTWFNSDFILGESGVKLLSDKSKPSIPNLPDSITSWSIKGFSLSSDRGLCVMNPLTFSVSHSLFIEVNLPNEKVFRGNLISIEITLFSYMQHAVSANISLLVDNNICTGSSSRINIRNIPPSNGEIASTYLVRFNMIPLVSGSHAFKIKMEADYSDIERRYSDTVEKMLKVEAEGEEQREVKWTLIEEERLNRRRSPMTFELSPFVYPIPSNSIPGTEKAVLRIHSFGSAAIREPIISEGDGSADTIAQYLYTMQFLISKLKTSRSFLSADELLSLTDQAQRAYTGLLRYVRDTSRNNGELLCGFSYSPAETAKPDLWLTSATLQIICQLSELVEINPEEKVLVGSLNWVLSHQYSVKLKNFFANKPVTTSPGSRKTRQALQDSSARSLLARSRRKKNCNKTQAGRQTAGNSRKSSKLNERLNRRVYRTAVVAVCLNSVLLSTRRRSRSQSDTRLRPSSFDAVNIFVLEDSLRRALYYIGFNILEKIKCRNSFRPLTLVASARAMFMLSGRRRLLLERKLKGLVQHGGSRESWIENESIADNNKQPTKYQQQQLNSSNVEATAYALQFSVLTGTNGKNFANWLLKQRRSNNRWVSLKDTLASMASLETYVLSTGENTEISSMRVKISNPGMSEPLILAPFGTRSSLSSEMELPLTSNTVNMTLIGSGNIWAELDMIYNLPTTNQYNLNDPELICPFDFSISITPVGLTTFQQTFARASSDAIWQITLGVRYKPWYDPSELGDTTYVVDFGLHSNYDPIMYSLDQLSNPIEKIVDSYRISKRSVLFYISEERNISFQIKEKREPADVRPLPISVYPAASPEQRCRFYYSLPGTPAQLTSFCSNENNTRPSDQDTCFCAAARSCPRVLSRTRSTKITTEQRLSLACKKATKFVYRIRVEGVTFQGSDWQIFHGFVRRIYKKSDELDGVEINQNYTFWVRRSCETSKILLRKDFLLFGRSAVQTQDGMFKHLLDSDAKLEQWPGRQNNCDRFTGKTRTVCRKLNDFGYQMRTTGCSSS